MESMLPMLRRRRVAMPLFAAVVTTFILTVGLPTDFSMIFVWLWGATICWNIAEPPKSHLLWLRDWGPLLVLLLTYDISRGWARSIQPPHIQELIDFDRTLFGGELPNVWLQEKLYDPDAIHWWDVLASVVYMSHFVASLIVAVVLYLNSRGTWAAFMRRWLLLTGMTLVTYFLYPAAPPWWASRFGYVTEHVERMSGRGWHAIGLDGASRLLDMGVGMSNPTAAMPSLHSGWAAMIVAFFLPRVAKKWWPLLLAYPLAMTFTLVYTGDHYIVDVLVAWTYVAISCLVVSAGERWWRKRTAKKRRAAIAATAPMSPVATPSAVASSS